MTAFMLTARDNSVRMTVRARCISCARGVAASNAGAEGTRIWRDPDMSTVALLRDHPQADGKPGLISRNQ